MSVYTRAKFGRCAGRRTTYPWFVPPPLILCVQSLIDAVQVSSALDGTVLQWRIKDKSILQSHKHEQKLGYTCALQLSDNKIIAFSSDMKLRIIDGNEVCALYWPRVNVAVNCRAGPNRDEHGRNTHANSASTTSPNKQGQTSLCSN